jgi:transcriptional regulator with XRE-family HTH domain
LAGSDEGGQSGAAPRPLSPVQSRAARGLLGWSEADLAAKAGLDAGFVRDFEAGTGDPPSGQVEVLRSALMTAGVAFSEDGSSGVRLTQTGGEGTRLDALTTENDR